MKSCYIYRVEVGQIAIADLCDYYGQGMLITRINVPEAYRGQGYGRKLLQDILVAADTEGKTLYLEILASGHLSYEELEAWYMRNGFKKWQGIYRRRPQAK